MRKFLGFIVVLAVAVLAGCGEETLGEKIERKARNAADDIDDAVDELK